jgi:PTS system galactitol-specific IIA component
MSKIYMDQDLIKINVEADNNKEVIENLSKILLEKKLVKKSYNDEVLKREKKFPTGLNSGYIRFAIPHTEAKHVNKTAMAVAVLKDSVAFNKMENSSENLDVKLVFLLAVNDPDNQVKVLQKLMSGMQNKELVDTIINSRSKEEILDIIDREFLTKF